MAVSATMIVKNQTNAAFTTTISDVTNLTDDIHKFNTLKIEPYKKSEPATFTTTGFAQSQFKINYLGGDMVINLGPFPNNTGVVSNNNPTKMQAVLAPNQPVMGGFKFYLYGGPSLIAPLINSVINANLTALKKALPQLIHSWVGGDIIKNIITSVDFTAECLYAAAVPTGQGQLDLSAVVNVNGAVSGSQGRVCSVTNFTGLVEGHLDLSGDKPKIEVTLFACSLERYELPVLVILTLVGILTVLGRVGGATIAAILLMAVAAATPVAIAGSLNDTELNAKIVGLINDALKKV